MEIEKVKSYGIAVSDLEGNWGDAFKTKLKKKSQKVIFSHLSFFQKIKMMYLFLQEKKKASKLDLSEFKTKGMKNQKFIDQQLEYISMFSAMTKLLGLDRAKEIMISVMEATAVEAFSQSSPEEEFIQSYGDSFEFFRNYFHPLPEACLKAGCLDMTLTENTESCFQFEITWCIWLELARKMNIPEACIPNCYADDFAYPDYFKKYGIKYSQKGTLAKGAKCCDLRFERM